MSSAGGTSDTSGSAYYLSAVTIFLAAFLLFLVQPMIGKRILPFFGGSTAVWATSLIVFTGLLFLGYAYAYWLSKKHAATQLRIHAGILLAGTFVIILAAYVRHSIYPSLDWTLANSMPPAEQVIFALLLTIGIPYFLLATTSPLLQHWYSLSSKTEPYKLYAISNVASFIALALYPFVFEPILTLEAQAWLWSALYLLFAICCVVCALFLLRSASAMNKVEYDRPKKTDIAWRRRLEWIGLAALPAAFLVATTTEITQVILPIPLLWVIPLALYLASFVVAFSGSGSNTWVATLCLISIGIAYGYLGADYGAVAKHLSIDLAALFLVSLFCHARIYDTRPGAHDSSILYLCTSFGGMLGVLCASLLAPIVFNKLWDFSFLLAISAALVILLYPAAKFIKDEYLSSIASVKIAMLFGLLLMSVHFYYDNRDSNSQKFRDFYSAVRIVDFEGFRRLFNGSTLHGIEYLDPKKMFEPTSYYGPDSGIGRSMNFLRSTSKHGLNVAVIGLGTGSIAAYCQPRDTFVYYEIDPLIERIAEYYFAYLKHCPGVQVRIGDARVRMQAELREGKIGNYDLIAVDAFSDDTVPTHLLTKEAFDIYSRLLRPGGLVTVHASNKYLFLAPVAAAAAEASHFASKQILDSGKDSIQFTSSNWVVTARDETIFSSHFFNTGTTTPTIKNVPAWTDDHADIAGALNYKLIFNSQ